MGHCLGMDEEHLPKVKRALEDERMLKLPDRAHIDEWRIMQDFAAEQEQCRCHPDCCRQFMVQVHFEISRMRFNDWV